MRRFALITPLFLSLLAGCGEECETISVPVCEAFEDGSNPVLHGHWEGTFTAHRYMMGSNPVTMDWYSSSYSLEMERESRFYRVPLYRDSDMTNMGQLAPGQHNFKVQYRPGEWWYLSGSYWVQGANLIYQGRIRTHGESVGRFRMHKPRACIKESVSYKEVCSNTFEGFELFSPVTGPVDKEKPPVIEGPQLTDITLSPNPVTTGGMLHLSADATPRASREWEVWISPATDSSLALVTWNFRSSSLNRYAQAPTVPGNYLFWVKIRDDYGADTEEYPFAVTLPF